MVMHNDIYADNNAVLPRLLTGPIKSAHALITRDIAMRILRGEYPPGSLLPPESDLIDQYTVSRTASVGQGPAGLKDQDRHAGAQ